MHKELRPEQIDILVGSAAVNDEFSKKVKELDRRLKVNGMSYNNWETLNDRQHDVFSHDMFLDGECATSVKDYVMGAVNSCGCPRHRGGSPPSLPSSHAGNRKTTRHAPRHESQDWGEFK